MKEIRLKIKLNDTGKFRDSRKYAVPLPGGFKFFSSKVPAVRYCTKTSDHLTFLYHECSFVYGDALLLYRDLWLMSSDNGSIPVGWISMADRQFEHLRDGLDRIPKGNYTFDPCGKMVKWTREMTELITELQKKFYLRRHTAHHSKCISMTYRMKFVRAEIENLKKDIEGRYFTDTP